MEDSVSVGERSVSGHHNNEAQEWRRVSTSSGGVVPSSPPSAPCSDRRSEVVERHGSLSLSFPVGMHTPTSHMGPLGVWRDGRSGRQGLPRRLTGDPHIRSHDPEDLQGSALRGSKELLYLTLSHLETPGQRKRCGYKEGKCNRCNRMQRPALALLCMLRHRCLSSRLSSFP